MVLSEFDCFYLHQEETKLCGLPYKFNCYVYSTARIRPELQQHLFLQILSLSLSHSHPSPLLTLSFQK